MDIEKVFNDLESNQTLENDEARKKLVELFTQTKETWAVHYLLDYFVKTGSTRVIEVLVKVLAPHDTHIFDRLDDWLKTPQHRLQALNVFCFIVRRHPTWLYKIEKHRLIKSVFKLLTHEKDIVPLMSALLCIITLLPIIRNSVPNFLNDLFDVFGHLASWQHQNTYRVPDEKLMHLQLGLQMLFHRLYGMYPCNFICYLTDFIKKPRGGGVFQHTIKPLLYTVRMHPMLLTATAETEVTNLRWKDMEPHDVVLECAHMSLPVVHPDSSGEDGSVAYPVTPNYSRMTSTTSNSEYCFNSYQQFRDLQPVRGPIACYEPSSVDTSHTPIWSPLNEITTTTSSIPLTPTAQFMLPLPPTSTGQLLGMTGSSPPEAAVEATPETTPMKDIREFKQQHSLGAVQANSHAVRAIFANSQPSSPLRKDQNNMFNFPDISAGEDAISTTTTTTTTMVTRVTTTYDRRLQQIINDRISQAQSPQLQMLPTTPNPEVKADPLAVAMGLQRLETKEVTTVCGECNETDRKMCSAGGLHMLTSRSMQQLARGIKRRNRMASYCCNDTSYEKIDSSSAAKNSSTPPRDGESSKMRRTKSLSALPTSPGEEDEADCPMAEPQENGVAGVAEGQKTGGRLQRSGKMLAMGPHKGQVVEAIRYANAGTQTLEVVPQHYENALFEMLFEGKEQRKQFESQMHSPQEILNQYIMRSIGSKENFDTEQYQLMCLQLLYESYRRDIHAERNRRLLGRSRDKRSLEMERDRLREQLKSFDTKNKDLAHKMDTAMKLSNDRQTAYNEEIADLKTKYQHELDQNRCLRQANDDLQTRLSTEMVQRKDNNYELEALRGQIFSLTTELEHTQQQAEAGMQYKQELARLEAEFIIMGEVQVRCRDRLAEVDNNRARDEEMQMLQESYNMELKDLKHTLDEKTSLLDSTRHKISDLQAQLINSEKVITEQKRLLRTVKDEYEEMFKTLNRKYETQKKIIIQMEEKLMMVMTQPQSLIQPNTCSPDTDRTDIASSMDRNSPLSTSLASSESLSVSLRSTELKNLQQLVETPAIPEVMMPMQMPIPTSSLAGSLFEDNARLPLAVDLASSASTASAINIMPSTGTAALPPYALELHHLHQHPQPSTSSHITHAHPHLHLQQQQQQQQQEHSPEPQHQMRL